MGRWLGLLGALGFLSGCGLVDLLSDSDDPTDEDDTDEVPTGGGGGGGGLLGGGNSGGGVQGGGGMGLQADCELGAEAICVCLEGGYYACTDADFENLVQSCLAGGADAEFVLCVADLVTPDLQIDCYLAADECTDQDYSPTGPY